MIDDVEGILSNHSEISYLEIWVCLEQVTRSNQPKKHNDYRIS